MQLVPVVVGEYLSMLRSCNESLIATMSKRQEEYSQLLKKIMYVMCPVSRPVMTYSSPYDLQSRTNRFLASQTHFMHSLNTGNSRAEARIASLYASMTNNGPSHECQVLMGALSSSRSFVKLTLLPVAPSSSRNSIDRAKVASFTYGSA